MSLAENAPAAPKGWILYDDSCGVCRRWIPFWEGALRKRGFDVAPLQAEWVVEKLRLTEDELLSDLRLLLADGSQIRGADVYRYAMRRIWWTYPSLRCSEMFLTGVTGHSPRTGIRCRGRAG
jgi:predicted DCC family thiol-disulfide oxidoreductase YuxK